MDSINVYCLRKFNMQYRHNDTFVKTLILISNFIRVVIENIEFVAQMTLSGEECLVTELWHGRVAHKIEFDLWSLYFAVKYEVLKMLPNDISWMFPRVFLIKFAQWSRVFVNTLSAERALSKEASKLTLSPKSHRRNAFN